MRHGPSRSSYCAASACLTTASVEPLLIRPPAGSRSEAPVPGAPGMVSLIAWASRLTALSAFSWLKSNPRMRATAAVRSSRGRRLTPPPPGSARAASRDSRVAVEAVGGPGPRRWTDRKPRRGQGTAGSARLPWWAHSASAPCAAGLLQRLLRGACAGGREGTGNGSRHTPEITRHKRGSTGEPRPLAAMGSAPDAAPGACRGLDPGQAFPGIGKCAYIFFFGGKQSPSPRVLLPRRHNGGHCHE